MLHCSQLLFFASSETKHIFKDIKNSAIRAKKCCCFLWSAIARKKDISSRYEENQFKKYSWYKLCKGEMAGFHFSPEGYIFFCIKICHTKILNIVLKCLVYIIVSLLSTGTVIQKFFSVGFSDMINIQVFLQIKSRTTLSACQTILIHMLQIKMYQHILKTKTNMYNMCSEWYKIESLAFSWQIVLLVLVFNNKA